jgi:hypothetical protein
MKEFESMPSVSSELYDPSSNNWDELWPSISKLEDECFPGKGLGEDHLKGIFESDTSIVVILKNGSEIIGFSCGIPDENVADAIYIETTEITPSQQEKGYVVKMMNLLEGKPDSVVINFLLGIPKLQMDMLTKYRKTMVTEY